MKYFTRGGLAALFFSTLLLAAPPNPVVAANDAPSQLTESGQRPDGLTYRIIGGGASPTEAIEIWFRCPADGYDGSRPGIARLAALAIADDNRGGPSLRDIANGSGGEVAIQVFPAATEFGIVVPAYLAGAAQDAMLTRIFHPSLGDDSLKSAKLRMAEQLSLAGVEPDIYLRERLFASIFSNGPYRDSTFGTAATLDKLSLTDVQGYIADAFRPANAIAASAGLGSQDAYGSIATSSAATGQSRPLPRSSVRSTFAPVALPADSSTAVRAVALGWVGPPISDQRAATAMDFLSDYLMRDGYGTAAVALAKAQPESAFDGQFITLQDPGIMFAGVWGTGLDRRGAVSAIRAAVQRVVDAPLPDADFARASIAFQTHLLHDMDGPQSVADNVGWYFAQGATAYTPVDMIFGTGGYEAAAGSLTPGFVRDIARRYLSSEPAVVTSPDAGGSIAWIAQAQGDR